MSEQPERSEWAESVAPVWSWDRPGVGLLLLVALAVIVTVVGGLVVVAQGPDEWVVKDAVRRLREAAAPDRGQ